MRHVHPPGRVMRGDGVDAPLRGAGRRLQGGVSCPAVQCLGDPVPGWGLSEEQGCVQTLDIHPDLACSAAQDVDLQGHERAVHDDVALLVAPCHAVAHFPQIPNTRGIL